MASKTVKYIAEGFLEDAGRLLNDFVETNSAYFSEFAEVWRKHNFSWVFGKRPDHVETTEFTNEIFRISTTFLSSPSFYQKVGAVYLIFCLFRMQISVPIIKVRIERNHWRIITTLRRDACLNRHFTLIYVIDYLTEKALLHSAFQMLKGPNIGCMQKQSKHLEAISAMKANYKTDILEYSASNSFKELRNLHAEYLEEKRKFKSDVKINLDTASEVYKMFESDIQALVNPEVTTKEKSESVGSRRAKLKAQSFVTETFDRFGNVNVGNDFNSDSNNRENEDDVVISEKIMKTRTKQRRLPKELRKVGRPRKYKLDIEKPDEAESSVEMDINYLLSQQQGLYLPPEETAESIKRKTKRDPYYKLSPKHETMSLSCSDTDNNSD